MDSDWIWAMGLAAFFVSLYAIGKLRERSRLRPCPRCGHPVPKGTMDCPHCGFDFWTIGGDC